jgi:glyoxylase-like metal-dependent hydrolase (beta-lactamase superfamily II)
MTTASGASNPSSGPTNASATPGASGRTTSQAFFDPGTSTVSYVVWDHASRRAAVIDPVLDYAFRSGRTSTGSADRVLAYLRDHDLRLDWILETHAHADHLSAAQYLKDKAGGKVAIGAHIRTVQDTFGKLFHFESAFVPDGHQFDHLFADNETFRIGETEATALWVPGHTPADMAFLIDGGLYVGDTLFLPDVGTARADFPGGDARALYRSIRRLLDFPADTAIFVCHDYPPTDREPSWRTTVRDQRAGNIHVRDGIDEEAFVAMRTARDATLDVPMLLVPSIQVNVRAGHLPPPDDNGVSYLRIPVNRLGA